MTLPHIVVRDIPMRNNRALRLRMRSAHRHFGTPRFNMPTNDSSMEVPMINMNLKQKWVACVIDKHMIQICSGITSDRVLNGELYTQRLQKLIYLHLLAGCFMKISL